MQVLAIIPARGGSKGIPEKNLIEIDGKPLICYTIESALRSNRLSKICVSSDHQGILELASKYPVDIHERSHNLAGDSSPVTDTIKAIISENGSQSSYSAIMLLQPTAPIREGVDIDNAIALLESDSTINSVISVCPMNEVHPARMYWEKQGRLNSILPEFEESRRQDIPVAYYRNGSIYLVKTDAFKETGSVMAPPIFPYKMPAGHLLNIDDPRDVIIANSLIPIWKAGKLP